MLKNYLTTAFRNLYRQKGSSFLNIAGLTLGITCSLVLFLLVKYLATFDNYHVNRDRIYRVVTEMDGNEKRFYTPGVPAVLPDAFRQDFPEAEEVTFTSHRANAMIKVPQKNSAEKKYQEELGVVFAQPSFFKIFDRPVYIGDVNTGLDEPGEAVISRSLAKKYFGRDDAIGEVVRHESVDYRITAVIEDFPENTDFPFNLLLSYITIANEQEKGGWGHIWSEQQCYFLLKEGETIGKIESRMPSFVEKHIGKDNYSNGTFTMQPLRELHFDDRYSTYTQRTAPKQLLVSLGVIALFLILTACINFINLTTAEAIKRSKEVGIRKTLGSTRRQLTLQFLGETTLVTVFAMLLSLGFAQMVLELLNPFLELPLALNFSTDPLLWVFVLGITLLVSLLSGLYPSLILSGYNPALALKAQISNRSSSGFNLRRSLVVVQFVISQFFIMGTIILLSQMNYFHSTELGFQKDAVLVLPVPVRENPLSTASRMRTLREEVSRITGVEHSSLSSTPPSSGSVNTTGFYFEGQQEVDSKGAHLKQIDDEYLRLYNIPLLAGSNVADYDTARGVVVNEEFVRVSGFQHPDEVLGKNIVVFERKLPVIGVVRDFHTVSLRDKIEPIMMLNGIDNYGTLSVKVNTADLQQLIAQIRTKWEAAYPEYIFEYEFLDDDIREFYEGERKMSILLTVFTTMAIFIGCLGLFGLASFMANQRTKEVGVRKAMGASVESIIFLFSKEYLKLILIGFLLASPAVWFLMNQWLDSFAYKISIGPMVFLSGLLTTFAIAVGTVGYKSFMAAMVNPIDSLRYE